jgi:hygromycin-B 7''-O-kinase
MKNLDTILPAIHSDEEFEALKLNPDIFEVAAKEIINRHDLPDEPLSVFSGSNIIFSHGKNRVIKIFPPMHQNQFISESLMMKHLHGKLSVSTPAIEYEGNISDWPYIVMTRIDGVILEGLWKKLDHSNKMIIIRELGALIREVHSLPTDGLEAIDCHWEQFIQKQIQGCVSRHQSMGLPLNLVNEIPDYLASAEEILPKINNPVILTGEYTPMNFLVKQQEGVWHITGLIDFGDAMLGLPQYDLLGPGAFLIQGDKKLLREFLVSYGYSLEELTATSGRQLNILMLLHRYSNLNVQVSIENWKDKVKNLNDLEELVWGVQITLEKSSRLTP